MAQPPHHTSPEAWTGLPKQPFLSPPTPRPAYYAANLQLRQQQMICGMMGKPPQPVSEAEPAKLRAQHANNLYTVQPRNEEMDDDDEVDGRSPIHLRISTALHVSGNSNTVVLSASPAEHAKALAQAVMSAVRQCSDMNGGIPMIDEEGRPRPIDIAVDAGMSVEGSGNILENEKHVMRALGGGDGADGGGKRKRDDGDDGEGEGYGLCDHRPRRRMRRSSV